MSVITQLYFQIVEENNYMFRPFFWVGHHQVETRISEKTHILQCGHQAWGTRSCFTMFGEENPTCRSVILRRKSQSTALALLRHTYMGSSFLDTENVMNLSMRATWSFGKQGSFSLASEYGAQWACFKACKGLNPNTIVILNQLFTYT
jgi:hypothetical protein